MLTDDLLKFNIPDAFLKAALCLQCASGMPEVRPALVIAFAAMTDLGQCRALQKVNFKGTRFGCGDNLLLFHGWSLQVFMGPTPLHPHSFFRLLGCFIRFF